MSQFSNLKSSIRQAIKQNGNGEITGNILQSAILSIINALLGGSDITNRLYRGLATPETNPGSYTDEQVFYIASKPGNYVNFSNLSTAIEADNKIHIIYNDISSNDWFEEALDLVEFMPILKVLSLIGNTTISIGTDNKIEGENILQSLVVGKGNVIGNSYCLANGNDNKATGSGSHAEGFGCEASGGNSHAEGNVSKATGVFSHSEGYKCIAEGGNSHAEGDSSQAKGSGSHAEGYSTTAHGDGSHAEGNLSKANGSFSHAEGFSCTSEGTNSHTEGNSTIASGENSHAEGNSSQAKGSGSHAEGDHTVASGRYSHAEGFGGRASGEHSHKEGFNCIASGEISHAEGTGSIASGQYSHAENSGTASGTFSHAEGTGSKAEGFASHVEGYKCIASGEASHAEGSSCTAGADNSHAGGMTSVVENTGLGSFAHGTGLHVKTANTFCIGNYNFYEFGEGVDVSFIIGTGESDTSRLNALIALANGSIFIKDIGNYEGLGLTDNAESLQDILYYNYLDILDLLSNTAIYVAGEIGYAESGVDTTIIDNPDSIIFDTIRNLFLAKKGLLCYTRWKANISKNIAPPSRYGIETVNGVFPFNKQTYKFSSYDDIYIADCSKSTCTMKKVTLRMQYE